MRPNVKVSRIRPGVLLVLAAAALALSACQTSRMLAHPRRKTPAQAVKPAPKTAPARLDNLTWLGKWFAASPEARSDQLNAVKQAYAQRATPHHTLRLALLLGMPGPGADLPRAQSLLQTLLADPAPTLTPADRALARLDLTFIAQRLTAARKNRTLQASNASEIKQLNVQLSAAADQNVALQRQLDQARAKLAAIANIEKSLNAGKLGGGSRQN